MVRWKLEAAAFEGTFHGLQSSSFEIDVPDIRTLRELFCLQFKVNSCVVSSRSRFTCK